MRNSFLLLLLSVFGLSAVPALAQQIPFTIQIQGVQGANNATVNFTTSAVGQSSTVTVTGTYTGTTTAVLSAAQILGAPEFTVNFTPLTLQPRQSFTATITFTPTSTSAAVAQLSIPFLLTPVTPTQPSTAGSITLNLNGAVPNFSVNYILPPNNNITPVADGGSIVFPPTLSKSSTTATIVLANLGSGSGLINSVAISGTAFQLQGLGLLPAVLQAGNNTTFTIRYSPQNPGTDTGKLTVVFGSQTINVNLTGTGISSIISYTLVDGDTVTPVPAGQQITVPDTPIGVQRSVSIQVQNTGTAPAVINSVSALGAGFTVTDLPFLPITLQPGDSFTSTVNFTPTQAGAASGTLTIGSDRFRLVGNGIGAQLQYSYTTLGSTTQIAVQPPQGTVLFSSATLGQSTIVTFTVTNTGTTSATLTSLGIVGAGAAAFNITSQTPLPAVIAPKASYSFVITFVPLNAGLNTASLLVNGQTFTLSGFGAGVPSLQSFQFTGASGQVQPFSQPSVGLTISQPYPLALAGQLTMTLTSNVFVSDPAVQFSTGGRTVPFFIQPGATQATFINGSTQIGLQTGTVAENINIGATFTTQGGAIVTPAVAPSVTLTVGRGVPQLLSTSLSNFTATGFTVNVTGYSTPRTLSKINFQFAAVSGVSIPASTFSVDVAQSAGFYFSSSASQQFGGFFSINIPITVTVKSGSTPSSLAGQFSVTATAVNDVGNSNSVTGQ